MPEWGQARSKMSPEQVTQESKEVFEEQWGAGEGLPLANYGEI